MNEQLEKRNKLAEDVLRLSRNTLLVNLRFLDAALNELELIPADDTLACSPLMLQLAAREDATVAQFGQAVGAVYFGVLQEEKDDETK